MDMGSSSSMAASMSGMASDTSASPTSAAGMSMATGSSMGGMGGMGGMDMGAHACRISMLWNWTTIDACFLARSWHITSAGGFAGSCIGVIFLVVVLEFLRRIGREYDKFLVTKRAALIRRSGSETVKDADNSSTEPSRSSSVDNGKTGAVATARSLTTTVITPKAARPTLIEQAIRATIHMLQFAVAYFVMLLAMYYNGYIIICIFIGAWIGAFTFSWDQLAARSDSDANAVTGCCG